MVIQDQMIRAMGNPDSRQEQGDVALRVETEAVRTTLNGLSLVERRYIFSKLHAVGGYESAEQPAVRAAEQEAQIVLGLVIE